MNKAFYSDLRLGIVGGGQLGRMLIQAAIDLNLCIHVLDPAADAPCRPYAHRFTQGSLTDYDTVMAFGREVDVLTIEIENVSTAALADLKALGKTVLPDPDIIALIQDKRSQKVFFVQHGLPTAPFRLVENRAEVQQHADMLPAVHKLGREGYDGRGVQVLRSAADLGKAFDAPGVLEAFVPFEKELAVLAARDAQGHIATYPVVEMVFHPEHNLVEYLFAPAAIPAAHALAAQQLARQVLDALGYVGLMAVELFYLPDGELLINELAPRPHNSGHHSIRACYTSQYEQHLRAILDLPLGSAQQMCPAAMINLLGEAPYAGKAVYAGMDDILGIPGVYPHIYGKAETRPHRKMGHITVLDHDRIRLIERVQEVRARIRVVAEERPQ
ncbi:MAG: 5-(carboxyamino)imidazole ribonucleotide synthase [Bacteroidia bacterium]